jgi:hypothetical protein
MATVIDIFCEADRIGSSCIVVNGSLIKVKVDMSPRANKSVSRDLIEHYLSCLKLTREALAREATPYREADIRSEIKKTVDKKRKDRLEAKLKKMEEGQLSPSLDAINRMLRLESTTSITYNPTLAALRALTEYAHDDGEDPLTPEILPVPIDLITKLYKLPNEDDTQSGYPPYLDGIDLSERQMSLFEAYYDLGQAIRMSDKPKTLYAAVATGLDLRFLLNGISDVLGNVIDRIVVRFLPIQDSDLQSMRLFIMTNIYNMVVWENVEIERHEWKETPLFLGFMYGDESLYLGKVPGSVSGYPWDGATIKLTNQDGDRKHFERFHQLFVHGEIPSAKRQTGK